MNVLRKVKPVSVKGKEDSNANSNLILGNNSFHVLDLIPSPVACVNNNCQYEYVNKAYCELYDTEYNDIVGKTASEFLGIEVYDKIKDYIKRALAGEVVDYVVELPHKGADRTLHAIYTPLFDSASNVVGYLACLDDFTDRQKADKDLGESEHRYRKLIENLPAAVYTTDKDGYITMYNAAAAELWGRQPEIGKDMWCGSWKIYEVDGITALPLHNCPMAIALREKRKVIATDPLILERPDGSRRFFIPHPEPMFDQKGNMTGAFNMLVDVTEGKMLENERARLAAIVQSSEDAIIGKNLNGIITSWNEAAEKLFGYTEGEMIGHSITKLVPADRNDEEPEILKRLRKGERVEHFETKRVTKNGTLLDISATISPIRDSRGNVIGASKIARDITERRKVDEVNAWLAAIVQSSEDAIIGKTLDGIVTSWNNGAQKLFGYTEEEMIGQSITKLIPTDRPDEEPQILTRLRKGERVEHFETKRVTKAGGLLDISLTHSTSAGNGATCDTGQCENRDAVGNAIGMIGDHDDRRIRQILGRPVAFDRQIDVNQFEHPGEHVIGFADHFRPPFLVDLDISVPARKIFDCIVRRKAGKYVDYRWMSIRILRRYLVMCGKRTRIILSSR